MDVSKLLAVPYYMCELVPHRSRRPSLPPTYVPLYITITDVLFDEYLKKKSNAKVM